MSKKDYLEKHGDKVLCFIEDNFAYFTSNAEKQWGDDWDDKPYEHNAGIPYLHDGVNLEKLAFESNLKTPAELANLNSNFSVKEINERKTPWLYGEKDVSMSQLEKSSGIPASEIFSMKKTVSQISALIEKARGDDIEIYAGISMIDFIEILESINGEVYLNI